MRTVFLFALLTNIVYFLWQYQQGALEKILNEPLELNQSAEKQILLLSEAPLDSVEENNSQEASQIANNYTTQKSTPLAASLNNNTQNPCYQVGIFSNDTAIDKWAEKIGIDSALLQREQKNKLRITGYLVFYPKEDSFAESKKNLKMLKQLGIKGVQIFQKGEFKGDISLAMFKTETKAKKLQQEFFAKSIYAAVKPRYNTAPKIYVKLQTDKSKQQLRGLLKGLVKTISIQPLAECF